MPLHSQPDGSSPRLGLIRLHPIKSLDGLSVASARIGPAGGLEFDRVWALFSPEGQWINGKNAPAVQRIRAEFSSDARSVRLAAPGGPAPVTLAIPGDTGPAAAWFSEYFDRPVEVRHSQAGFPDDPDRNGPTIVSTASLERVASWFPDIDLEESRRRFRTPLEIDGVPAFWEDRLFRAREEVGVRFVIGDVAFEGVNPCPRCPVPARDSRTGADSTGFQRRFSEQRRAEYPAWAVPSERIGHFYHLSVNTRVARSEFGKTVRVGDPVIAAS